MPSLGDAEAPASVSDDDLPIILEAIPSLREAEASVSDDDLPIILELIENPTYRNNTAGVHIQNKPAFLRRKTLYGGVQQTSFQGKISEYKSGTGGKYANQV